MTSKLVILTSALLLALNLSANARTALVIGNGAYTNLSSLANPGNDARDMASTLTELGFDVQLLVDASQENIEEAVLNFGDKLLKDGGVGLFYYAGHGVQDQGRNYLIPVEANIRRATQLKRKAVDVGWVLEEMAAANNGLNMVILDACRDNPFAGFRSADNGLAKMESPKGTFIAYATAPGDVAADGTGRNGLFTKHLLTAIQQPDQPVELAFKYVVKAVIEESRGRQTPFITSSLTGDFYFKPKKAFSTAATSVSIPAQAQEISILWHQKIGKSSWRNTPVFVGQYLYVGSSGSSWNKPDSLDGIYAFEAKTGNRKWFYQSLIDVNEIAFMEGFIIGGNDLGEVFSISAISGKLRWKTKVQGAVYAKPAYSDTGVVIATGKGKLYLLDLANGNIIDEVLVDGGVRAGLTARGHHVYVATENGTVYEFTTFGRFNLWNETYLTYPDKYGNKKEHSDKGISNFSQLGDGKYSKPSIYSAPLLLDNKVIMGFVRQTSYSYPAVLAFSLGNGGSIDKLAWYGTDFKELVGHFGNIRFTPAYYDGYLYFGNPYSNEVYALNADNGKVVWSTELGQPMFQHWPSPIIGDKFLYVAKHDGYLHKLDPKTGARLSSIFLGLKDSAGLVFYQNDVVPGSKFRTQWNPSSSFSIFSTPAYSQGVVVVGSDEGYLYAVKM